MKYKEIPQELEEIATAVVDAAFKVHKALGPGLFEKVYEIAFCHEIRKKGFNCKRKVYIPVVYDGIEFEEGLRLDVMIR